MQLNLKKFTHINKMERLAFRIMKPISWILFAIAIVPFFVFLGFFLANLFSYLNLFQQIDFSNNSTIWYRENVINVIDNLRFYFLALSINIIVLLGLRAIAKALMILRTINQYISYAYQTYHNKPKLIITLIILLIGMCFLLLLIVSTFILFFWTNSILINSASIIHSNDSFASIKDSLFSEINKFNNYHLKEQTTFILLIFGLGGWLLTNITHFFYIIYFIPKLYDLIEGEWKFVEMYNQMKPSKNLPKYGHMSSYDEYNNRMTNGFSHRMNPRDKQYEIYKSYDKTKK